MLNKKDILDKMVSHFSRWMDIRKRTNKSNGGQLLMSISEEMEEIQQAIDDYKKDFFIESYEGIEDSIVSFLYKVNIGKIGEKTLEVISPIIKRTYSKKDFYETEGSFLYMDNNIYIKPEDIVTNELRYTIDKYEFVAELEKIHVWNVFDEFAAFLSLKRQEGESNSHLINRVHIEPRRRTDSTAQGIKNAIRNELINIDASIKDNDILIEIPTIDNLQKHYNEFEQIIDKMIDINKDVYKTKRWDIDPWEYKIKTIDYIPHVWDALIESYEDGVGYNDSLEIVMINETKETNAVIKTLNKSESYINTYIKDKNIKETVELELIEYKNYIKPIEAKFRIDASNVKDITNRDIKVSCNNISEGKRIESLHSLIANRTDVGIEVEEIAKHNLNKGESFKLLFHCEKDFEPMKINKLFTYENNEIKNLITMDNLKPNFKFNDFNEIYNIKTKKHANRTSDFIRTENAINNNIIKDNNILSNVIIKDINNKAKLALDITDLNNELIKIDYSTKGSRVFDYSITSNNFKQMSESNYVSTSNSANLEFKIEGNQIFLNVKKGTAKIIINDKAYFSSGYFESPKTDTPQMNSIRIENTNGELEIEDIKCSNYSFKYYLESGEILKSGSMLILPDFSQNTLYIEMMSNTIHNISISNIYIGYNSKGDTYQYEGIWEESYSNLFIDTNCRVELIKNEVLVDKNYKPFTEYKGLKDRSLIEINVDLYEKGFEISPVTNGIVLAEGNKIYLQLKKEETCSHLNISGMKIYNKKSFELKKLLNIDSSNNDKIFISSKTKEFIIEKNNKHYKESLYFDKIGESFDVYKILGLEEDIMSLFQTDINGEFFESTSEYKGSFNRIVLNTTEKSNHIAYNSYKTIREIEKDIEIIKNFSPYIEENLLMYYEVTDLSKNHDTRFYDKSIPFESSLKWSLGMDKLQIKTPINLEDIESYYVEKSFLNKELILSSESFINRYEEINGSIIDLAKTIIKSPEGYEILYRKKETIQNYEEGKEFFNGEMIIPEQDYFNKLEYSNIDEIIYIGTSPWTGNMSQRWDIDKNQFNVLKEEGFIIWKDKSLINMLTGLYVVYTIKIPYKIKIDINILYKERQLPIDAYEEVSSSKYSFTLEDEYYIKKKDLTDKKYSDINIYIDNPGVYSRIEDENIVFYRQNRDEKALAIKPGFYYINGKEYYHYKNASSKNINKNKEVILNNVIQIDDTMIMNKESYNYVRNAGLELKDNDITFSIDYTKKHVSGISKLNSLTACDNYNSWISYGTDISLSEGINDICIKFNPLYKDSYSYIDITELIKNNVFISMFASNGIIAEIGQEKKFDNQTIEDTFIEPIKSFTREGEFLEVEFLNTDNKKKYLIIRGEGLLDDIILTDSPKEKSSFHNKNINRLGIDIKETKPKNRLEEFKVLADMNELSDIDIKEDGTVTVGSSIEWGITNFKTFNKNEDWKMCSNKNVSIENGSVKTNITEGYIITPSLFIGDPKNIKCVHFKINSLSIESLTGFTIIPSVGSSDKALKKVAGNFRDNIGTIDNKDLNNYLSLNIKIPKNKSINSLHIYIEYKTSSTTQPKLIERPNGTFLSKIIDSMESSDYRLKDMLINKVSNLNEVEISIRAARAKNKEDYVWSTWKTVRFDTSLKMSEIIEFKNYRFFQVKVLLKSKRAYINIDSIVLEAEENNVSKQQ